MSEWVPTSWTRRADLDKNNSLPVMIHLVNSPFYEGDRYAVRVRNMCLNVSGGWEYEPMPSSRDDAFYGRCRFASFDDALAALAVATPA